jgi:hypothetical protein
LLHFLLHYGGQAFFDLDTQALGRYEAGNFLPVQDFPQSPGILLWARADSIFLAEGNPLSIMSSFGTLHTYSSINGSSLTFPTRHYSQRTSSIGHEGLIWCSPKASPASTSKQLFGRKLPTPHPETPAPKKTVRKLTSSWQPVLPVHQQVAILLSFWAYASLSNTVQDRVVGRKGLPPTG